MEESNAIRAHIFGRSRRGDREEVSMRLYHVDGSPFVPGGGEASPMFHGVSYSEDEIEMADAISPVGYVIPIGNLRIDVNNGFVLEDGLLQALPGAYVVNLRGNWSNLRADIGTGYLKTHLVFTPEAALEGEEVIVASQDQIAPNLDPKIEAFGVEIAQRSGVFKLVVEQTIQSVSPLPMFQGDITIVKV